MEKKVCWKKQRVIDKKLDIELQSFLKNGSILLKECCGKKKQGM